VASIYTRLTTNAPILRAEGTRMRVFPWPSRAEKQHEKRDGLETQGVGFNLGAIWSFLDDGRRNNESDEA
jgi:hypothetical protein